MVALSLHSVVPVRAEAREGAEQNTQMLFGELCEVIEHSDVSIQHSERWRYIRLESDGQEGWVDAKMISPMTDDEYAAYKPTLEHAAMVAMPMAYAVSTNNGQTIPLTAGTRLPKYADGQFEVLGVRFRIDPSMVITAPLELNEQNLLQAVRFFLNVPYLWGGKNAMGMDCSGFSQVVMSLFGKQLLRNASEQATQGKAVARLADAKAGDLAFFDHYEKGVEHPVKITHVGIVIDPTRIVHCSGRVKVEKLDETGIYNIEQGGYSHRLASIRSFV
ncbi:MAG: C40 family peptidase [Paludibacteraceae bacterium]|nr:C40 family peptidase [Paludibacteraceae bacterium]